MIGPDFFVLSMNLLNVNWRTVHCLLVLIFEWVISISTTNIAHAYCKAVYTTTIDIQHQEKPKIAICKWNGIFNKGKYGGKEVEKTGNTTNKDAAHSLWPAKKTLSVWRVLWPHSFASQMPRAEKKTADRHSISLLLLQFECRLWHFLVFASTLICDTRWILHTRSVR